MAARLIALKFMLSERFLGSDPERLLSPITVEKPETPREQETRTKRGDGRSILQPTDDVCLEDLIADLEAASYTLVGARAQRRLGGNRKPYMMVRFLFAPRGYVQHSAFGALRDEIGGKLACLALHSMWQVEVYDNPFYENGVKIEGEHCLEIACRAREPLYDGVGPDKRPRLVWNNARTEKVPLRPRFHIELDDDDNTVVILGEEAAA